MDGSAPIRAWSMTNTAGMVGGRPVCGGGGDSRRAVAPARGRRAAERFPAPAAARGAGAAGGRPRRGGWGRWRSPAARWVGALAVARGTAGGRRWRSRAATPARACSTRTRSSVPRSAAVTCRAGRRLRPERRVGLPRATPLARQWTVHDRPVRPRARPARRAARRGMARGCRRVRRTREEGSRRPTARSSCARTATSPGAPAPPVRPVPRRDRAAYSQLTVSLGC